MANTIQPFPGGSSTSGGASARVSSRTRSMASRDRSSGQNKALCIGINDYPEPRDRLHGCVNDVRKWAAWFSSQGFAADTLLNGAATRQGILDEIKSIIQDSSSGDVIAIQYSGHGTQMEDPSGDEDDDGLDEAMVPFDHRDNGYIIDDDLAEICDDIPSGVGVNFFLDCCHSGSATRSMFGVKTRDSEVRERFLRPDQEMREAHRKSRRRAKKGRSFRGLQQEILFSACQPHETAKERGDQGDFTRYALQVLKNGIGSLTNAGFVSEVHRVGTFTNQAPQLWARGSLHDSQLLASRTRSIDADDHGRTDKGKQSLRDKLLEIEDQLASLRQKIS